MAIDKYNHDPKKNTPAEQAALKMLRTAGRPQVAEADFARYYVYGLHDRVKYPEQFAAWLEVASTVNHQVDVIKDGQVAFVVPSILMPYPTEVYYDSARAVTNIVDRALGNGAINPALVEVSMRQELAKHFDVTMSGDEHIAILAEYASLWDEIFDRYGLPMRYPEITRRVRLITQPNNAATTTAEDNNSGFDFDFGGEDSFD